MQWLLVYHYFVVVELSHKMDGLSHCTSSNIHERDQMRNELAWSDVTKPSTQFDFELIELVLNDGGDGSTHTLNSE